MRRLGTASGPRLFHPAVNLNSRRRLRGRPRKSGAVAARTLGCPKQPIHAHLARRHFFVPGVIDDVFGLAVRADCNRVVARAEDLSRDRVEDAWARFGAFIRVRSQDVSSHAVIDAVVFRLPATAAVETIITSVVLAHTGPFERMPIPILAVHQPVLLTPLPIMPRAQNYSSRVD